MHGPQILSLTQYRSLPYLADSLHYFNCVRPLGDAVFLDSGRPRCPWGRFDIIAAAPVERLEASADSGENPFTLLDQLYRQYQIEPAEQTELPFCGGLIGHFSYDLARHLERLPNLTAAAYQLPDMRVGLYLWAVVADHHKQKSWLVAAPSVTSAELDQLEQLLRNDPAEHHIGFSLLQGFQANMSAAEYHSKLARIDDYIHAGDCYQVNFAQRFQSRYQGDPWRAYQLLREVAPTPYSAYLESEQDAVLSLSPEQFLELKHGKVQTRPIKGTRPRSTDAGKDRQLKHELYQSEKDRAENLMIVDLLRNDLSRVCEYGSVRVPELFKVESYANVHHLVSTITGSLPASCSPVALLQHCFPGGSITGAPKIRAMEIIEELEPHRRSVYCGSIGYISLCGRMDTSITIRTLLCEQQQVYCWAGGGIVADSDPSMEYEETFNKVNNLLHCLEQTLTT